ncbi:exodeoxyribonuclease III [Oerskovia flava]|uniref:exodeoxyribonuclease III n=1 Tax=Oerskovia flava TaxID=2986422 RepID=UPI00223FB4EA|nr:exodeoxyribonuclease III [Oerskovia sp. JB1-3-2]
MLTIATSNVNGIRAAYRKGMGDWVATRTPDVLLLQEVRAPDSVLNDLLDGWHVAHQASDIKGRAGVAVASRLPVHAVRVGLGRGEPEPPVDTGRWVEADVELASGELLTVVSAYLHSGVAGTPKMDEKYAYLAKVTERMRELAAGPHRALVAGDLNIAHRNVDIKNWKGNLKSAGFLPEERAYVDVWLDEIGFTDLGRRHGGEGPGPFTWWSWRGQAFANDSGWRIDYQLASPTLAESAVKVEVDRATNYEGRWSDHAPLVATYDL